jgi:hypothetical protein
MEGRHRAQALAALVLVILRATFLMAFFVESSAGQLQNASVDESVVLKRATTVAVFIELGPAAAAPYRPDFTRAKKQISDKLTKQKMRMVKEPADVDILLIAREFNENRGVSGTATTIGNSTIARLDDFICLGDEIKVYKGGKMPSESDVPIWSSSEVCGFSWPLNRLMDKLAQIRKK